MSYFDVNQTEAFNTNFNLEARARSIATNAVMEYLRFIGRGDKPVTDHDSALIHNVYQCLCSIVHEPGTQSYEHQSLAIAGNAPEPSQIQIAAILDKIDEEVRAEKEPLVKAKVPTAKA